MTTVSQCSRSKRVRKEGMVMQTQKREKKKEGEKKMKRSLQRAENVGADETWWRGEKGKKNTRETWRNRGIQNKERIKKQTKEKRRYGIIKKIKSFLSISARRRERELRRHAGSKRFKDKDWREAEVTRGTETITLKVANERRFLFMLLNVTECENIPQNQLLITHWAIGSTSPPHRSSYSFL